MNTTEARACSNNAIVAFSSGSRSPRGVTERSTGAVVADQEIAAADNAPRAHSV
jgi:hypothetical protein